MHNRIQEQVTDNFSFRGIWFFIGLLVVMPAGCVPEVDEDSRRCPCDESMYTCCVQLQQCFPIAQFNIQCPWVETETAIPDSATELFDTDTPSAAVSPLVSNLKSTAFDGVNDYLDFGDLIVSTGTISLWIKTSVSSGYILSRVISGGGMAGEFRLILENGRVVYRFEAPELHELMSDAPIHDNAWHHIAVSFNPGMAMFIDGKQQRTVDETMKIGIEVANSTLVAGCNHALKSGYFTGALDEISVYSKPLAPAQILELWNERQPAVLTNVSSSNDLLHWWRMGDGDFYPVVQDRAGTASHALMENMSHENFVSDTP